MFSISLEASKKTWTNDPSRRNPCCSFSSSLESDIPKGMWKKLPRKMPPQQRTCYDAQPDATVLRSPDEIPDAKKKTRSFSSMIFMATISN
jgi:hypothetical protein